MPAPQGVIDRLVMRRLEMYDLKELKTDSVTSLRVRMYAKRVSKSWELNGIESVRLLMTYSKP